jgi:hypothetical protein
MKPSLLSCWSPFRSPEVKEIYANLTPEEIHRLKDGTHLDGAMFGFLSWMVFYILFRLIPADWGFFVQFAIVVAIVPIFGFFAAAPLRKHAKNLLCDSAYAREKGYTPENLRLYSFRLW